LKKKPTEVGLITSAPVWLRRCFQVAARRSFFNDSSGFQGSCCWEKTKGGQHVTTREEIFVGCWPLLSSPLAPDYYSVFSRKVLSHLLKKEPTDLLDDSSGAKPQYNLALS